MDRAFQTFVSWKPHPPRVTEVPVLPVMMVVAISIPAYIVPMMLAMPTFRKRLDEKFSRGAENQSFLVESVTNIQTLKAGAVEPQAIRR